MKFSNRYDGIIVFTNGAIGDFLMAILFLDAAKKALPNSMRIIITPRNIKILNDLLSAYPGIETIEIHRHNFFKSFFVLIKLIFSKIIIFDSVSFGRVPIGVALLSSILAFRPGSRRVGFLENRNLQKETDSGRILFDYNKSVYENIAALFNTQNFEISYSVPLYNFTLSKHVEEQNKLQGSLYVVVHPCASTKARSLPVERWRNIIEYISYNFPHIKIVITGSSNDVYFIEDIIRKINNNSVIVNLAGKISMNELTNLIYDSSCFIGVDTGISHLAGVIRKPSIIIGNLSNPCWLPTYNKNAIILANDKNCSCDGMKGGHCFYVIGGEKYYRCMVDIADKTIYKNINRLLSN